MTADFSIDAAFIDLTGASTEDDACRAAIGIRHGTTWLTTAEDAFASATHDRVVLSAYRLAAWLAENWWRLRWEPRGRSTDWQMSHRLGSIGGGYIWPNIVVQSDGHDLSLHAQPTRSRIREPIRYTADLRVDVPADRWEQAIDTFLTQVLDRLRAKGFAQSQLQAVWDEIVAERADPGRSLWRRFEALLGCDPDGADEDRLREILADAASVGSAAMQEIVAGHDTHPDLLTATALREFAASRGYPSAPADAVPRFASHGRSVFQLSEPAPIAAWEAESPPSRSDMAVRVPLPHDDGATMSSAWRIGASLADALRRREALPAGRLSNARLAEMAALPIDALNPASSACPLSFALDATPAHGRVVLRSKWESARRFDVARLIGDRLLSPSTNLLFPATEADTRRQKIQRAFAAELLCPLEALQEMLQGDYDEENLEEAAHRLGVPLRAVTSLMIERGHIERS